MIQPSSPQTTTPKNNPDYFGAGSPQSQTGVQQGSMQDQINDLYDQMNRLIAGHIHNGSQSTLVSLDTDVAGLFEVVSLIPVTSSPVGGTSYLLIPTRVYDQIKIYTNGTTYRLYWYDTVAHNWHYATGT